MKVVIDSRWLFLNPQGTGINIWTFNLLKALSSLMAEGSLSQFYNFTRKKHIGRIEKFRLDGVETKILRIPSDIVDKMLIDFRLPMELFIGKFDIFHGVRYFVPRTIKARTVLTIHDMYHIRFPGVLHPDWQRYLDNNLGRMANEADRIITVSEASRKDIINFLDVDDKKVINVWSAFDHMKYKPVAPDDASEIVKKYVPSGKPYFFYVGLLTPWKNLVTLIEAFEYLKERTGFPHVLLLGGKRDFGSDEILQKVAKSRFSEDIILPGYVPDDDLPALYSAASVFVFPSLWEGFGLPLLEAMSCGTPVIAGRVASIPEIVGEGGILVDPKSSEDFADAMERMVSNDETRNYHIKKAEIQSGKFHWENVAKRIIHIYDELV